MTITIVEDFTDTPGGRHIIDGPYSGEQFRIDILKPKFEALETNEILTIDFDGGYGYPVSFLEESFGGLAREFGKELVLKKLKFKSDDEARVISDVLEYIKNA